MPTNTKLSFSTMIHNDPMVEYIEKSYLDLARNAGFDLNWSQVSYDDGWSKFVNNSIYGGQIDVSEMGSTWVNDFAAMSALHPFPPYELNQMGGQNSFIAALVRASTDNQGLLRAIPWLTDVSLVYYRRDLLQKAGISETGAFSSPERLELTLQALQEANIKYPWVASTHRSHVGLHNFFSWLISEGCNPVDANGRRVLLMDEQHRRLLRSYLSLARFMDTSNHRITSTMADDMFGHGQAAVTISGPWLLKYCSPQVRDNLGLAIPLNAPYVGGSCLVVWNSSARGREAFGLIQHLVTDTIMAQFAHAAGLLPARVNAIAELPVDFVTPEHRSVVSEAIGKGTAFPNTPLWGMIEDRLVKLFDVLWEKLLVLDNPNMDEFLDAEMVPVVKRLNMVLANYDNK